MFIFSVCVSPHPSSLPDPCIQGTHRAPPSKAPVLSFRCTIFPSSSTCLQLTILVFIYIYF